MKRTSIARALRGDTEDALRSLLTWRFWRSILITAIGCVFIGVSVNGVLVPYKFLAGGTTGLSLLVYYAVEHIPLTAIFWAINIPLFVLGWRAMSLRYLILAIAGVLMSGIALELTKDVRIPVSDPIIAAIFSGVLSGTGIGLYLRVGGSTGGLDIIAAVLKRKFAIPMGVTYIRTNMVNLMLGAYLHSLDVALYTAVCMYVTSWTIERVQAGFSQRKAVFVITDKPDAVAEVINNVLDRGVTFFNATAATDSKELRVVYTVINLVELGRLKELLYRTDANAFIAVHNCSEVIGKRFLSWEDDGFSPQSGAPALAKA